MPYARVVVVYDEVELLRKGNPAWALLRADHAALVLSFLDRVFVDTNASAIPAAELVSDLDDELYALNERLGAGTFPRAAAAYLDDWADPSHGWLRKFYPPGSDEPHYDLAPAVEKALAWVRELRPREFIGTESRLNTIFELLRQMVQGADTDPARHLADLQRRRAQLDAQIARAEQGQIDLLDAVALRDRYQQFARTARELLADFREVEENFRQLDRRLREQIAGWEGSKGALLDELVGSRSSITDSDQGRSFRAFYDFLLSAERRAELTTLLEQLSSIGVEELDPRMQRIHFDWIDASERTQATVRLLSEQLRRFLDDQTWLEDRRVIELLRGIESSALRLRPFGAAKATMEVEEPRVPVVLPMERPLHTPPQVAPIESGSVEVGEGVFDATALLEQVYVDREQLVQRVLGLLRARPQVSLTEVIAAEPLTHGLAELVGYLALREPGLEVVFDDDGRAQVRWTVDDAEHADDGAGTAGLVRVADLPRVTFERRGAEAP